jgi:predicted GIY-YIG superfamily endonuclease
MAAWVYILKCADGSYYTGSTTNLEWRISQHIQGGGSIYTKSRLPVKLVYAFESESIVEAKKHEHQIKGWSHAKKEALIRGDYSALVNLSKSKQTRRADDRRE